MQTDLPPGGIGVVLKTSYEHDTLGCSVVRFCYKNSPAQNAAVQAGDAIMAIDDTPCHSISTQEVARRLRGPLASRVKLTLFRRIHPDGDEGFDDDVPSPISRSKSPVHTRDEPAEVSSEVVLHPHTFVPFRQIKVALSRSFERHVETW